MCDAAAVRLAPASQLAGSRRGRLRRVEGADLVPQVGEIGEQRRHRELVSYLVAQPDCLLLERRRPAILTAGARDLARADEALGLDAWIRAAGKLERLPAPAVRNLLPPADDPVEPHGSDQAQRALAVRAGDRRLERLLDEPRIV